MSSIAAHDAAVATGAMPQILLWVSAFEAISSVAVVQMLEGSGRAPGNFGFDPYNLYSKPGMEKKKVRFCLSCLASRFVAVASFFLINPTVPWWLRCYASADEMVAVLLLVVVVVLRFFGALVAKVM